MVNGFVPQLGQSYSVANPSLPQQGVVPQSTFVPQLYYPVNTSVPTPGLTPVGSSQVLAATPLLSKVGTAGIAISGATALTGGSTQLVAVPATYTPGLAGASEAATGVTQVGGAPATSSVGSGLQTAGAYATAALAGYWGGSKIAEMLDGNPTGGAIGGSAGATIGMYAGGPVGAIIGGLAGSTLGQFFGNNKPSDFTQAGGINLNTQSVVDRYAKEESSTGKKYNSNVAKLRDNVQQGASAFTKWLIDNGATPKEDPNGKQKDMLFIVGGRDGFRTAVLDNGWDKTKRIPVEQLPEYKSYGKDYKAYSTGIANDILSKYNVPDELKSKFESMKQEGAFNDIAAFGQSKESVATTASFQVKDTRRDMVIKGNTGNTKSWSQFLNSYNEKYTNNKVA